MRTGDRIAEKLKYSHFLRVVFDTIARFGLRVTPYYLLQEGIPGGGISALEKGIVGYEFRLLRDEDMGPLSRIPGRHVPEGELTRRLKEGHYGFGLFKNGEAVAFTWANPHKCDEIMNLFDLHADEAYLYDAYTLPAYRGKKLAPYLRYQSYRALSGMGRVRLYSMSDALNTPSIKFKKRLGARFVKLGVWIIVRGRWEGNFTLRQSEDLKRRLG